MIATLAARATTFLLRSFPWRTRSPTRFHQTTACQLTATDSEGPVFPRRSALCFKSEEDRNQNQNVNRGSDHASNDRGSNRLHHVGPYAGFPENGNQTSQHHADGHQLRSKTLDCTFDDRSFDVLLS